MKVIVFLAVLLVGSLAFNNVQNQLMKDLFAQWKLTHGKSYKAGHDEEHRFNVFVFNYLRILEINQAQSDVVVGLNQFADLTSEEFTAQYLRLSPRERTGVQANYNLNDLPSSVDWRAQGAVAPVQNQGSCGSCWAFSAVGALEGLYFVDHQKLVKLSEQQLVDCVEDGCEGCNGGWMDTAFEYTAKNGIESESDYPYKGRDQKCKYEADKAIKVNNGFYDVKENSTVALKTALVAAPVAVAIQADQAVFQFYRTGVITKLCGADLNHGVLAVGYDTIGGVEGFIVKNSWGAAWGNGGYVYIGTDETQNKGQGVCGILAAASQPTSH